MDPIADAVSSHDDSGEEEGFEDSEDEDDGDLLCRWKTRSRRKCARWRWKMHGERIVESDQGEYKVWFDCWYHGVQFIEQRPYLGKITFVYQKGFIDGYATLITKHIFEASKTNIIAPLMMKLQE
ncbi:hypothetical protein HPP92_004243 [Vanilla planifolia]|uniref:Uncharacterized protein n=1 Tax=Vanilla planifolia TaxID=51239 RepID=A0A835RKQ4_VANPL|nr:hypothetical protein HPP92_004243 [Vanilla planifolia]